MSSAPSKPGDPREIAKWAERYARSRTIPFLVQWVFIIALAITLGALSLGALTAWRTGHRVIQWMFILAVAGATLALLWFSISRWGRQRIWTISQWVYGKEGYASYGGRTAAAGARRMRWLLPVGIGLALYHLAGAVLVGLGHLDMGYLQPYSAVYMVPFLAVMIVSQRLGVWAWIWPLLYALHAILLLVGAPIHFRGEFQFLDVIIPVFLYGAISMIVGHLYSRYAFKRLKQAARQGLDGVSDHDAGEEGEE